MVVPVMTTKVTYPRADSRFAPSQWETLLQSNGISYWLGANLESALYPIYGKSIAFIALAASTWFLCNGSDRGGCFCRWAVRIFRIQLLNFCQVLFIVFEDWCQDTAGIFVDMFWDPLGHALVEVFQLRQIFGLVGTIGPIGQWFAGIRGGLCWGAVTGLSWRGGLSAVRAVRLGLGKSKAEWC